MRFSRVVLSVLTLAPFLGALANSSNERRQESSSMASLFSSTQSKIDGLITAGTQPINDPGLALTTISNVFDLTNIVNAAMDTFNVGDESLFVDLDGKELDDIQMAEKVVQLWQSVGNAASLVKGSGSETVAEVVHMIAFNLELCSEDILRVAQGVAKLPNVVEAAKANQDLMTGIVSSILGSSLVDSLSLTE
ncbi:unnamed protein product [Rhizoctonia solani]|uniref:Cell wall galactomannoprotein n=1 Tax=Rhizoctonia solani TaxID=456999 RepID=A0A8H3AK35_9AGAM|nr:unnamed protein product [Rhizoctonia solani]